MESSKFVPRTCLYFKKNTHVGLAAKTLILESKFYLLALSFAECIFPFTVCLGIFFLNFLLFCNCNSQLQNTIFVFTAAIFYKD